MESWELKTLGSSVLPTMILCGCSLAGWAAPEPSARWDLEPWRSPDTRSLVVFPMTAQQTLREKEDGSVAVPVGSGSEERSKGTDSQCSLPRETDSNPKKGPKFNPTAKFGS